MNRMIKTMLPAAVLMFAVGCAQSGSVSEDKPIEQVAKEAEAMSAEQLEATVEKYKAMIASKSTEIEAIKEKLKTIPVTELMGEEAKAIKADIEKVSVSVSALTERMKVYAEQLKAKMAQAQ